MLADEVQSLFQEIVVKHKHTLWAVEAKREKGNVLGLNWQPASLMRE
jgi:hypothetical protein